MDSPLVIHINAKEMRPSVVGARVLDPNGFLELVVREIRQTGRKQRFDGDGHPGIQLRSDAMQLVSTGDGWRSEDPMRHHVREGKTYLKREYALPATACIAYLITIARHNQLREQFLALAESKPFPWPPAPLETTHVLYSVMILHAYSQTGQNPNLEEVADEAP